MFNRFFKTIHNHYSKFFKIFYFLRYLIPIFFAATILYISIPKLFDYENKKPEIKSFLLKNYQLELISYSSIKYNIFPLPNISLENVSLAFKKGNDNFKSNKINIYLNFESVYGKKLVARKVSMKNNKIILKIQKIENLLDFTQKTKLKLNVKDLDLDLTRGNKSVVSIKDINFSNYGFKKNKYDGIIFNKKFEIDFNKEKKDLNFHILDTGVNVNFKVLNYMKNQLMSGTSKISILNNYFKLNYQINKNKIILDKSKFRNKDLSFSFKNIIDLNPYFEMDSVIKIERISNKFFKKINLDKILSQKDIIKKFNGKNRIEYKGKNIFKNSLFKEYNSQIYLENGRISEQNEIKFPGAILNCNNEIILIDDFPRFYFNCKLDILNSKKFNKYFSISKKKDYKILNFDFKGNLNLYRNKINFEKINIDNNKYIANEEDKIFFKKKFEEILFTDGFFNIFETNKIKNFIDEII